MTDDTTNTKQSRVAADCPNERLVSQADKIEEDVYINAFSMPHEQSGPVVRFNSNRGDVIVMWNDPPNEYTRHLQVVTPMEWDEYDAACYSVGKSILDHFTGK